MNVVRRWLLGCVLLCGLGAWQMSHADAQETFSEVRKRGHLKCGVSEGLVGFSQRSLGNRWRGFDVDYCRAVASAIFKDDRKVRFEPLSASARFDALASGQIDVLSRNTTWTMTRDITRDLDFVGVSYFDVQGLMVPSSAAVKTVADLVGKTICALKNTTQELGLQNFLSKHSLKLPVLLAESRAGARRAYLRGLCAVFAGDLSALAAQRLSLPDPDAHEFLPYIVAKEPLGPVVRASDASWRELLQWILFVLVQAEEAGWTAEQASIKNLPEKITVPRQVTESLGLQPGWARSVIARVGNYAEVFDRNLGKGSALKLPRGLNRLWRDGGIMFSPPIR